MRRSLLKALAQFLATALTMWALLVWRADTHSYVYIWPLTGIQLAMILGSWLRPRERYLQLFAGTAGIATAGILIGFPAWMTAMFTAVHCGEVWLAATMLSQYVTRFEHLKRRRNVVRFGAAAILVPILGSLAVSTPVAALTRHGLLETFVLTAMSDSVGIAVVTPVLLFFLSGGLGGLARLRPHLKIGVPAALGFVVTTLLVFSQNSNPFLFMVFPAMVVTLFLLGLEGATFVTATVTVIACWQTAHMHGPIWVMHDVSMEHRIAVLQCFLWMVAAVAMPVGALLDERRSAEVSAAESQSIYKTLLQNSEDMILLSTLDGSRRYVSPGVAQVTGWSADEYLALTHLATIHPDDRDYAETVLECFARGKITQTFRYRLLRKGGGDCWVEASARGYCATESVAIIGYVATIRDISSLKKQEDEWAAEKAALATQNEALADLAATDELTKIANRRTFNRTIHYEAARHARSGQSMSLLMIDVDHFKLYNDIYGHPAGDECLRKIAEALQAAVGRVSDEVARVGGEEFAVVLPGTDAAGARRVAEDIARRVEGLHLLHEKSAHRIVSVSIGIATWPPFFVTGVAELIEEADRALYQAKSSGRNGISVSTAFSNTTVVSGRPAKV